MTSILGSDNLAWSDEQTRLYLQLRIYEKLKGNIRKQNVNDAGKLSIIDKFQETFGERHPWKKFGIKFTTCKKQYESFRKLTHNITGLGYDSNGFIEMSEDWWNERCKVWSGVRKIKQKPVANMDFMEQVFGTVHISGAEGWTAQQGEKHLDTRHLDQDQDADVVADDESRRIPPTQDADADDDAESRQIPPTQGNIGNEPSSSNIGNGPSSSSRPRASKKISSCSQLRAMEVLHSLPAIRMWSPLYKAAIQHLKQDIANRQTLLFYEGDENKMIRRV